MSCLEPHPSIYRLIVKGILNVDVPPFGEKLISSLVTHVNTGNFIVIQLGKLSFMDLERIYEQLDVC